MLNHTYTSVKNANLVNCGKKQHISSQPSPLLKENFLGEFRTELDKKKVLANLGIASSLSLEWEYIKGDIARSEALMQELDARTTYTSKITGDIQTLIDGVLWLESIVGGEQGAEEEQNRRLQTLETSSQSLASSLQSLKDYINNTISIDVNKLKSDIADITNKVNNITDLIKVSEKDGNALYIEEGETPGLYVPNLSGRIDSLSSDIDAIQKDVQTVKDEYVKREEFGDGDLDFVSQSDYSSFSDSTNYRLGNLEEEIKNTVKTGEDGHVDTLYVNKVSKDNDSDNIVITDSFEMESGIPLDVRLVKHNLDELYAIPAEICYAGMGVIVNSLCSLYILKEPEEGQRITQEYVSNPKNWKCPEDLVTIALERDEYDKLPEKDDSVFYYIYESEVQRTKEPNRSEFDSEDEFNIAWEEWVNSLKTLSQEYMSASWGLEIEDKVRLKADQDIVEDLVKSINDIKGGDSTLSLNSLNKAVEELQTEDVDINKRLDDVATDVSEVTTELSNVKTSLSDYVSKSELQDESQDFIFVKTSVYNQDKQDLAESLANKVITAEVQANNVATSTVTADTITLGNIEMAESNGSVYLDGIALATISDIPNIQVLSQSDYNSLLEYDTNTYYYTFEDEDPYVIKKDFDKVVSELRGIIDELTAELARVKASIPPTSETE